VCASPAKFKIHPWKICDKVSCFDDDYIAEEVEGIVINIDKFLSKAIY
jgi:hypothetical protein